MKTQIKYYIRNGLIAGAAMFLLISLSGCMKDLQPGFPDLMIEDAVKKEYKHKQQSEEICMELTSFDE